MPSRRELIAMSPEDIKAYFVEQKTLVIVSNGRDGYPHPMPMWFYADDAGCLYCSTFRKSQKVLNFRRDSKASLLIESGEEYQALKSVLIYAETEVIDDFDQVSDALVKINSKGRELTDEEFQQFRAGVAKTAEKRVLLKFTPVETISWDHAKLGGRY